MYRSDSDGHAAAREQLVSYSARLLDDGLAVGSAGNMSVRAGDMVAITPSGIALRRMRPEDICVVALDGTELDSRETPSSETPMHLAIYAATGAAAVVHTHSPEVIALSASATSCPPSTTRSPGSAGRSGWRATCGSGRPAWPRRPSRRWTAAAPSSCATTGGHLRPRPAQAYDRALLLEWLARTYRLALLYGEPAILSAAELDEVAAETRRRRYGERRGGPRDRPPGPPPWLAAARPTLEPSRSSARTSWTCSAGRRGHPARAGQRPAHRIRATAAGTGAGTAVDLAKLGASVLAIGALGDDLLGDILLGALARHGVETSGLVRRRASRLRRRSCRSGPTASGPRCTCPARRAAGAGRHRPGPALRPPTPCSSAPPTHSAGSPRRARRGRRGRRKGGALVAVDVLHPGRPRDFERLTPLLAAADWFGPNADQLLALTGRADLERRYRGRPGPRAPAASP